MSLSLSGSHADVFRKLSHKETRLFALPVEKWSAMSGVDREILRVAKTNPARLQTIYANNMEILRDLRERKDKLTEPEKLAHDQLSLGRRALAQALVETGHMTLEQAQKDGHPLMSRKALRLDPKYLRTLYEGGAKAVEKTVELAEQGARKGARFLNSMLDFAQDVR